MEIVDLKSNTFNYLLTQVACYFRTVEKRILIEYLPQAVFPMTIAAVMAISNGFYDENNLSDAVCWFILTFVNFASLSKTGINLWPKL